MCSQYRLICNGSALLTAVVLWLPLLADAQVAAQTDARGRESRAAGADEYTLRTYWVGDLILDVPDYPYPGGRAPLTGQTRGGGLGGGGGGFGDGGSGGGGFFSISHRPPMQLIQFGGGGGRASRASDQDGSSGAAPITLDVLIDAIQSTVAADTWAESGGEGAVRPVGNALVIWQTQSAHDQIAQLLGQLRDVVDERKTITIDARWLLLHSDDLNRLQPDGSDGVAKLDRTWLDRLTRRPTTIRGLTNCFSGQLVYIVSGTRRNFVSGYIPVVGSVEAPNDDVRFAALRGGARVSLVSDDSTTGRGQEAGVGYQPIVEQPNFGALLEIRPTLARDGDTAIVDLRSTVTVPAGSEVVAGRSGATPAPPVVDRISIDMQELATTLRMPIGEPVLVGGLTYVPPSLGSPENAATELAGGESLENRQYYLILNLR